MYKREDLERIKYSLFENERLEDYAALSLAALILIVILLAI